MAGLKLGDEGGGVACGARGVRGGGLGQQGMAAATAAHSGGAGVLGSGRGGPQGLVRMHTLLTLAWLLTFEI